MNEDDRELLAAYAAGVATAEECRAVERFLRTHPSARAELASFASITARLADTVEQHEPPAGALAAIHQRLGLAQHAAGHADDPSETAAATDISIQPEVRRFPWWRSPWMSGALGAAAVAACTLLAVTGISNQQLRSDLQQAERSRDSIEQRLSGVERELKQLPSTVQTTSFATSGEFRNVSNMQMDIDGHAVLVLQNMPKPSAGRSWQIWHRHKNGQVTTLGPITKVDDVMYIPLGNTRAAQVVELMITEEPQAGSSKPTGETVLEGTVV